MNSTTESQLYIIWQKIANKTSCSDADRIIEPVKYYIETGRCSGTFIRLFNGLNNRQLATIASRLIKVNGMDYSEAIKEVCSYILK